MQKELSAAQQTALREAAGLRPTIEAVGGFLWQTAEVGLQEYHSAAYLTELYRNYGFAVTMGVGGFPTGFVAEYKNGAGPVVALLCEYDALPALSTVVPGANGHGCGHNLFGAAATGCALLLRQVMEQHGVSGTLRVYGTPGEENYASKAYYVNQGLLDDVDCSVGFHPHDENKINYDVSAATIIKNYTFHGKPAHAGNCPWLGNSALDAVEIMNVACNFMREHVRPDARIQYIINKGGAAPNIVPELAGSQYMVRAADVPYLDELAARVDNCAHAAALATGCTVEIEFLDKTYNTVLLREYAELAQSYLELVGAPAFSSDELSAAKAFGNGTGLHTAITPLPGYEGYQGGATDEGDVSWVVPHVSIYTANVAQQTVGHSLPNTQQMNMPAAYTAVVTQVQATAAMLLELLESPAKMDALRAAHTAKMNGLRYPKNPAYRLPAHLNPNCAGVTLQGDTLTADLAKIVLLPKGSVGSLLLVQDSQTIATLAQSGSTKLQRTLADGESAELWFAHQNGSKQLVGYYTV